jgi:hypothetical protein
MNTECTDPLDYATAQVNACRHGPCWLCDGLGPIWDSGLCLKCYPWVEDNMPMEATEAEIIEAYRKPAMVQRLIAAIESL